LRVFLEDVSAVLVIRRLEIKALTLVLSSVSRAGAAVMALNGKSRSTMGSVNAFSERKEVVQMVKWLFQGVF
jgi:hypothetical protein